MFNLEKIVWVTNRNLCNIPLVEQGERVIAHKPKAVILREKDLTEEEYKELARQFKEICEKEQVPLHIHFYPRVAKELGIRAIHLPLFRLRELSIEEKIYFHTIGASVHSYEELQEALELGVTYVVAGHIFTTNCKKGLPPRGVEFLQGICEKSTVPVYAIGGIDLEPEKIQQVQSAGAEGACVMSQLCKY